MTQVEVRVIHVQLLEQDMCSYDTGRSQGNTCTVIRAGYVFV